jgi:hypothetical protein
VHLLPGIAERLARWAQGLHHLERPVPQLLAVLVEPVGDALAGFGAAVSPPALVLEGLGLVELVPAEELGVRDGAEPAEGQLLP